VALSGLAASTLYHYRVVSRDAAANVGTSSDLTFTTAAPPDTTPPVISGLGVGSISPTGATVSWTTDEASDAQVEFGATSAYGSSTALDATLVIAHSQALTGLAANSLYHYRVKSRDAAGNQATSDDFTFTTAATPDTTPPVISGVAAGNMSFSGGTVSWTTDEASDSQVEYGQTSSYGSSTTLDGALVLAHSVTLSGLTASTLYHYRVTSRDAAGNLATSDDFTFTTGAPPDTTPPVISGVAVGSVSPSGAGVSWTTDEASDSQVEYGLTASYGSTTTLETSRVVTHSVTLSGLSSGTTYHYRVKSRDAAGNLATSGDFNFTTNATGDGPVPIIVDTDLFSDADDAGALATAFGLQIRGEATVVAITVNTRTSRPEVATNSWKCAAAIAQFYNSASVPIGSDMPDNGTATNTPDFIRPCALLASPSTPAPDTAVNVFRRALVAQPNGSLVIVATGYEENLSALLHSSPDAISPLSGRDLVSQKVQTLMIMGGRYPSGSGENNLAGNPAAAQDVTSNWPTRIVWSGTEVGDAVHTGNTISSTHPSSSPVRAAYEAFVGPNNWIYSYDLTAVYHAVRPGDPLLSEVGPGTNAINGSGGNVFTLGSGGSQYYLRLTDATALDSSIEALLDTLPSPPADTTPPVISGVGTGSVSTSGAIISWTTDEAADSLVEYGLTSSYGASSTLSSLVVSHSVSLAGLAAGTTYHFRVKSRDTAGNLATSSDFTFTTASAPPPGPTDNFDGNSIDPAKWTVAQNGSTVAAANQELEITHPATATWTKGSIQSVAQFDMTGKCEQLQVKRAPNNGQGGLSYGEMSVYLWFDSTHYVEFFIAGGALTAWVNNGSGDVNLTPSWPHYSATAMQWLRFRQSGGTLYWEYAAAATAPGTWTVLASTANPFPLSSVTLKIVAGSNVPMTDIAQIDNISNY
jgi:phosphodiesterase/alkaline phosphatase D-like protein